MHALLLEGTYEWALARLPAHFRTESADTLHSRGARMGIDEVRNIITEAYKTPLVGNVRVFILAYPSYTEEAQNALLKILEEPPETARFYIITERPNMLLPTLRSRLIAFERENHTPDHTHSGFERLSFGERLNRIADHAKEKDEEWLTSLMEYFETCASGSMNPTFMGSVLTLKPYFHSAGASRKMILEHLALLL